MVYAGNTFVLSVGYNFSNFVRSIPRQHLFRIRTLVLYGLGAGSSWQDFRTVLASMSSLRTCQITYLATGRIEDHDWNNVLLPFMKDTQDFVNSFQTSLLQTVFILDAVEFIRTNASHPNVGNHHLLKRWKWVREK